MEGPSPPAARCRSTVRSRLAPRTVRAAQRAWAMAVACLASALLAGATQAENASSYYAGKTLKVIVGFSPGGGYDTYARMVARHIGRHIPGNPAVVVQNMAGAGSLRAVLFLDSVALDDSTVLVTFNSGLITDALTSPERLKVDFRKFAWIGNVSEDVRVCYMWHTSGVRNWQDMLARDKVVFGATSPGTAGYVEGVMLRELFGVKLKLIQGYPGSADKRLAIEKAEVQGDCGGWISIPEEWLRERKIAVLVRLSSTLLPGMDANVPFARDLLQDEADRRIYDFLMAPERLGRLFMASGRVPADRVAMLRAAFDAMVADPAFVSEAQRMRLPVAPMSGDEVSRHVAEIYATPAALVARAKTMMGE